MRTFEAATKQGYIELPCYRVGAMAVHRRPWEPLQCLWYVSHADTGLTVPGPDLVRLKDARRLALALSNAIDWDQVHRGSSLFDITGLDDTKKLAIRDALAECERPCLQEGEKA